MKQSKLFSKTSKNSPKDEESINARLLIQASFIHKEMAGVYTLLPLGVRVLSKIENIIRDEMSQIGAEEIFMPALHPKENWMRTGRWDELDVLFKILSRHGSEYALGPTHEEIVTPLASPHIASYRDLPAALYQIQTKFRDEPRAKGGMLRGREFRMKDLYSFHATENDLNYYYNEVTIPAYRKIFKRFNLDAVLTEASGGTFSKFSHEFQVAIKGGEDVIYICQKCGLAKNKEIYESGSECTSCGKTEWREHFASEAGNIFKLKTKYSEKFNLEFTDEAGGKAPVIMGCYGIGTSRLIGIIAEKFNDKNGLIWPRSIAPYALHLISLNSSDQKVLETAQKIYDRLTNKGVEVLFDDRQDTSAGEKFADADLIGIPFRAVISEKTLSSNKIELKERSKAEIWLIGEDELNTKLS